MALYLRFSSTIASLVNTLHENYSRWHLSGLSNQCLSRIYKTELTSHTRVLNCSHFIVFTFMCLHISNIIILQNFIKAIKGTTFHYAISKIFHGWVMLRFHTVSAAICICRSTVNIPSVTSLLIFKFARRSYTLHLYFTVVFKKLRL